MHYCSRINYEYKTSKVAFNGAVRYTFVNNNNNIPIRYYFNIYLYLQGDYFDTYFVEKYLL